MGRTLVTYRDQTCWHRWFAWFPVWIEAIPKPECSYQYVRLWWVWVERKREYHWSECAWRYREVRDGF